MTRRGFSPSGASFAFARFGVGRAFCSAPLPRAPCARPRSVWVRARSRLRPLFAGRALGSSPRAARGSSQFVWVSPAPALLALRALRRACPLLGASPARYAGGRCILGFLRRFVVGVARTLLAGGGWVPGRAIWLRSAPAARPAGARLRARGVPVVNKRDLPAVKLAIKWRSTYPHVFHQCQPLVQKFQPSTVIFPMHFQVLPRGSRWLLSSNARYSIRQR